MSVGVQRCHNRNCNRVAVCNVNWPGDLPIPFCQEHASQAAGIAAALGFRLTGNPIPEGTEQAAAEEAQRLREKAEAEGVTDIDALEDL